MEVRRRIRRNQLKPIHFTFYFTLLFTLLYSTFTYTFLLPDINKLLLLLIIITAGRLASSRLHPDHPTALHTWSSRHSGRSLPPGHRSDGLEGNAARIGTEKGQQEIYYYPVLRTTVF